MTRWTILYAINGHRATIAIAAMTAREAAAKFRSKNRYACILSIVCLSADIGRRPVVRHGANK